jgi:predicted DNA-binding transcriptional regulator AlpA
MRSSTSAGLLDTKAIAMLLGVRLKTVWTWRHRGVIPKADLMAGQSPLWKRDRIVKWAKKTGRLAS